jgi:hypothetical protein
VIATADQAPRERSTSKATAKPSEDTPTACSHKETSITKLAENLIKEKAKLGEWNSKTQRQVRSLVATFVEMIGDDYVRSYFYTLSILFFLKSSFLSRPPGASLSCSTRSLQTQRAPPQNMLP